MLRGVSFDALVVLGCRVTDGQLSPAAVRRVERAALAYREHGAQVVIAAGGKLWQGVMEADAFARELGERGVPAGCLLTERESLSTRGNVRGVVALLRGRAASRVGLVTCDWHMPRALRLFRWAGVEPTPLPASSPLPAPHLRALRSLKERGSLTLDFLLHAARFRA
jgi:uncharacterized SAM-binding protein YcdF (DUF218 family)